MNQDTPLSPGSGSRQAVKKSSFDRVTISSQAAALSQSRITAQQMKITSRESIERKKS